MIEALAGGILVCVVLADVFRSVVLPRATRRTLRLGPVLGSTVLQSWLWWSKRRRRGHASLGALGPLLIVAELLIWVALLIVGYALLLHATAGLKPDDGFGGALYAAASAFVTTGLSGQEASTGAARAVVAIAGFSGLAVVTLVVTFLLSVHSALLRREALVLRLRARLGPAPSGLLLLEGMERLGTRREAAMLQFFAEWEAWAADVLLTHRAFPILLYFRSTDEDCGWMTALGAVLDAAALTGVSAHQQVAEDALVCHRMGARLIADLARQFGLKAPFAPGLDRAAFDSGIERLAGAGYMLEQDADLAWRTFERLRSQHIPPLSAMAERFGETPAAW